MTFRNFRVEILAPKKRSSFVVSFDEVGMNTASHLGAGTKPLEHIHALLTLKGRVWIPSEFKGLIQVVELLDALWDSNQSNRTRAELNDFKSQARRTHPFTKIVIGILLVLGLCGVAHYFTVILPNIEV